MKNIVIILMLLGLNLITKAQRDCLEPEQSILTAYDFRISYHLDIRKYLISNIDESPNARIIVLPSFSPEYLVSIEGKEGYRYLIYRIMNKQIWGNNKNKKNKYSEYKIEFDDTLANKLNQLFIIAISKVKYPNDYISITDGTNYIFMAFEYARGNRSGHTSFIQKGKLYELTEITDWLVNCAKINKIINKDEMIVKIDKLTEKFEKD